MQNTGLLPTVPNHYQMQAVSNGSVPSREQTMEERKERMRQQLVRRKIPADLWDYFLESPEHWDFGGTTKDGLQKGISTILTSPHTITPCWIEAESVNKFLNLKMEMTTVTRAVAEIKKFSDEELPEDRLLTAKRKQAQATDRPPDKLQTDLLVSCSELTVLTVIADKCFSNEFLGSISAFVETTKKNVVNSNDGNANELQTKEVSNDSGNEGDVSVKVLETNDAKVKEKGDREPTDNEYADNVTPFEKPSAPTSSNEEIKIYPVPSKAAYIGDAENPKTN